jgi:microcystin-dependent protein
VARDRLQLGLRYREEGRMVDQFLGEIKLVGFNFAPVGWAMCSGQTLSISQYSAMFALLGTQYGGNGTSTFNLPDLRGRAAGNVGLNLYDTQGLQMGTEGVNLTLPEYPAHSHGVNVNGGNGTTGIPSSTMYLASADLAPSPPPAPPAPMLYLTAGTQQMALYNGNTNPVVGFSAGGNGPHENRMPYLAMTYCIALQGAFPPRS